MYNRNMLPLRQMIADVAMLIVVDFPIESLTVDFLQFFKKALPMIYKQELSMLYHLVPAFGLHGFLGAYVLPRGGAGLDGLLLLLCLEAIPRPFQLRNLLLRGKRLLVVSTAEFG